MSQQCEYVKKVRCSRYGAKPVMVDRRERFVCWQHRPSVIWAGTMAEQRIVVRWLVPLGSER